MTATEEIAASQIRLKEAQPTTEKPVTETPKDTENLDASMDHFRKVMLEGMPERKREAVKPEKPSDKPAGKPIAESVTPPSVTEPEKKPVKVTRREKAEPPRRSLEDVAAEAAARTVAALRTDPPKQETQRPEAPIPKEYSKQMAVFTEMAADNPELHGELPAKLRQFVQKEDAYIQKWLEENPGSDFDSNAEAHNDFYRRNEPAYDADDYDSARTKIAAKPLLEKEGQKIRLEMGERLKRLDEIEAKDAERELVPKIVAEQKGTMAQLLGAVDKDYASRAENPAEIEKLSAENPPAYRLVMETAKHTLPFVAEVVKLWDGGSKIKVNMENPLHRHIWYYERSVAERIKSLSEADQTNQAGQRFASWAEYQEMTQSEQKKHWIMGRDELIFARRKDAVDAISVVMELANAFSKRNGNGAHASQPTQNEERRTASTVPKPQSETATPSMSGQTIISTSGSDGIKTGENWADRFNSVLAGRRF